MKERAPGMFFNPLRDLVRNLRQSPTWQEIFREGYDKGYEEGYKQGWRETMNEENQNTLVRLGTMRFGPPSDEIRSAIMAVQDPQTMKELLLRMLEAGSWTDLLQSINDQRPAE